MLVIQLSESFVVLLKFLFMSCDSELYKKRFGCELLFSRTREDCGRFIFTISFSSFTFTFLMAVKGLGGLFVDGRTPIPNIC